MDTLLPQALLAIDRWSFVIYAVGALGVLLYLLRAREAYRQRRFTPFPIEREEATATLRDALVIMVIMVAILATTFYIDRILLAAPDAVIAPNDAPIAVERPSPTPTSPAIGPQPSDVPTLTPEGADADPTAASSEGGPDATPTEAATPTAPPPPSPTPAPPSPTVPPTMTPEPTPTEVVATPIPTQPPPPTAPPPPPTPDRPAVPAANCGTPGVQITSPGNGQVVSGSVTIRGTASIDRFQFYKVEYGAGTNPGSFASIGDTVPQPVTNGNLATWQTASFPAGVWALRLTVVDETGNFPPPCQIYVVIQ